MAQQALPAGAVRRRAVFGLLDADGWSWAGVKATFWFLILVFLLGYIPNVAYYSDRVRHGPGGLQRHLAHQLVPGVQRGPALPGPGRCRRALADEPRRSSRCRPRVSGAVVVQSGVHIYLVGGTTRGRVVTAGRPDDPGRARTATSCRGSTGPALPEPRTKAATRHPDRRAVRHRRPRRRRAAHARPSSWASIEDGELTGWALEDGKDGSPDSDAADAGQRRGRRAHQRRHLPLRRSAPRTASRTTSCTRATRRTGRSREWEPDERPAAAGAARRCDRRRSWVTRCTSSAARAWPAPRPPSTGCQLEDGLPATTEERQAHRLGQRADVAAAAVPARGRVELQRQRHRSTSSVAWTQTGDPQFIDPVGRARHGDRRPAQWHDLDQSNLPEGRASAARGASARRVPRRRARDRRVRWTPSSRGEHLAAAAVLPAGHPGRHASRACPSRARSASSWATSTR